MEIKESFNKIYKENIKREGADKLLEYLSNTDFFGAPASTNFHSACEGGLCQHSVKVYERYKKLIELEYGENYADKISDESIAIIALLHDVCKANFYKVEMRNVKQDGQWIQKPYFTVDDTLPYGHGEKSVYIIGGFMKLTREEAMAINWHMGAFDARVKGGDSNTYSKAMYEFPNALIFHLADVSASYLDEVRN